MKGSKGSLLLVVVLALGGCAKKDAPTSAAPPPSTGPRAVAVAPELVREGRVRTSLAERRALKGELLLAGEVVADEAGEAEVSTLVEGRIAELVAREGQRVKRGQVLAWIDAPALGRAAAEVLRARSRTRVAARDLARQEQLAREQATSQSAVDEARANDEIARAELLAARTLLASMGGSEPKDTDGEPAANRVAARAPLDGVVVRRNVVVGGPVSPGKPLFYLVSATHAFVRAHLPETAARLAEGKAVVLRPRDASAGGSACHGKVTASLGWVDAQRTVPLRITPDAPCAALVVGGFVDVLVETAAEVAVGVVVPKEAAVDVKGVSVVFVEAGGGKFWVRPVRLGPSTLSELVVESGVEPGERVATGGVLLLKGELLRAELESGS